MNPDNSPNQTSPSHTSTRPVAAPRGGIIAWFARNHVAANLLFFFLIFAGLLSVIVTKLELFPEISANSVAIEVPFPGATPADVERSVIERIEEAIADVEGTDDVRGTAAEGVGIVTVEIEDWADEQSVRDEIKNAVDRIDTFPEDAEQPIVSDTLERFQVMNVALHGEVPRRTLNELAEQIKSDLIASPPPAEFDKTGLGFFEAIVGRIQFAMRPAASQISTVVIDGVPPYEISVEVDEDALRRYGLTFGDVANAVRRGSVDLPAGSVQTNEAEVLIRTENEAKTGLDFARLPLRQLADGTTLTVGDVANVTDGFAADSNYGIEFDGEPAVTISVFRVGNEGALNVAATVKEYFAQNGDNLPTGVSHQIYNDFSILLTQRIGLMLKNAALGLMLVVIFLGLFLDPRLAFWSAGGLVMSFLASLAILPMVDVSINMITLFAYILVLGIVVDDAIVVGENIYEHMERGEPPVVAVVNGAREVAVPVFLTIASTCVAFLPLLFAQGQIGQILRVIPTVVIAVLIISLIEALLVLPAHLSGGGPPEYRKKSLLTRVRNRLQGGLAAFTNGPYKKVLWLATDFRYATMAAALAVGMITFGWVYGGLLPWKFFPDVDADFISVSVEMPPGTPIERTQAVVDRIATQTNELADVVGWQGGRDGQTPLVTYVQSTLGGRPFMAAKNQRDVSAGLGDNRLGEVVIQIVDPADRDIRTATIEHAWRELIGDIPGVRSLKFDSSLVSAGDPINVRLSLPDDFDVLQDQAAELKAQLRNITGVVEIGDSFQSGKPQLRVTDLTPLGRSLGLSVNDVAQQVRAAFFGDLAQRVQRGRDEVRVYVRYPESSRASLADIEELYIRTPQGAAAPLSEVAVYELGEGFSQIQRLNRERVINVSASIDPTLANAGDVNTLLREEVLPTLVAAEPRLSWALEGEQQEQSESLNSLGVAMLVAMGGIYVLLAVQFRSYLQPIIVMSAIPFGLVGAVWGHVFLNAFREMPLNFLSMFGVVALTGVVVNDSLILIDLINRKRIEGKGPFQAVREAGLRRCRPILLTTFTTFFGLIPMILETSLQAQFLIPLALSLGFGVLVATFITLLLVPALYLVIEDARGLLRPYVGDMVDYVHPEMRDAGSGEARTAGPPPRGGEAAPAVQPT
jgi:multidrug efflux pump subunit AcrB